MLSKHDIHNAMDAKKWTSTRKGYISAVGTGKRIFHGCSELEKLYLELVGIRLGCFCPVKN